MMPDMRLGKDKTGSQRDTYSVDAFLSIMYEGVAEVLPDRFVRRGRAAASDDPEWDLESDCQDQEDLRDFLDKPGTGAIWASFQPEEKKLTKFLPPGTVHDLYTHNTSTRSLFGAVAVSYSTFLRVYQSRWKDVLKFRARSMFSQCELCYNFKQDLSSTSLSMEARLGTLTKYRRHLADQYSDRCILWSLQEAACDPQSDLVIMCTDGMDQGKFRLPRYPGHRASSAVASANRPKVKLHGLWVWDLPDQLAAGIDAGSFRGGTLDCPISPAMAPLCRMLEQQLVKVQKPDEEQKKLAAIKDEGSAATPSPMKRLASDFEKKIKALPDSQGKGKGQGYNKMSPGWTQEEDSTWRWGESDMKDDHDMKDEKKEDGAKSEEQPEGSRTTSQLDTHSLDVIKGWTRMTCVAWVALMVSELDCEDTEEAREIMSQHLTFTKWKDSAFSTEQLRTTRWLLGARPKNIPDGYHELLTVTPMAQEMLMDLHVKSFLRATRRVKSAARSRARLCADDFDRLVDFACVFAHIRKCAMRVVSKSRDVDSKLMAAFLAKDYYQDIEAVIASKNPEFRVQSLTVWQDIVEPPSLPTVLQGDESADLLAAQEAASATKFNELQIRLTADCEAMNKYNADKQKAESRKHVQRVLHEKNQLAVGKKVVDEYMASNCWAGLIGDMMLPHELDKIIKAAAAKRQVAMDKLLTIGWVDLTKIGVLTQKDMNKVGTWCERLISRNPTSTCVVMALPLLTSSSGCGALRSDIRKLEDKLLFHQMEFRSFFLPVDHTSLHHNRDMPGGFTFYLIVSDATLPRSGTAHRANRSAEKVDRSGVNTFCFSKLWQTQVTSSSPRAIDESEFIVPATGGVSSAEGRRNYTDLQETSQWLGGLEIPKVILGDLLSGVMSERLPRYKPEIDEDQMAGPVSEPSLKEVRSEWLADPVRAPQWRQVLSEFDRCFGTRADNAPPAPVTESAATEPAVASLDWDSVFPDEPREATAWHTKYDALVLGKFQWCPELTGYIIGSSEGNGVGTKFFLEASEDYTIDGFNHADAEALLTYGAGVWLQDAKVQSYLDEHPDGKGVECHFDSDECKVLLVEENGQDGAVTTLREVIRKCESMNMVDVELGGHTYSRPPQVVQGLANDRFEVSRKENSRLLWRPNQVQASGLRATNAASFYAHSTLSASQGLLQVWRMRAHKSEKSLCAAKPLWFLARQLKVPKGMVQRIV
ncbi:unnamed protein product [Durusdinium trenchii]|uniref:Uncharacterized protein n=1 Tax=Durusdinium trenchii TaxID=1381693 RepID=A0ABP0STI5_9DINO